MKKNCNFTKNITQLSHNYKIGLYSIDSLCFNSHNPYRFGFNGKACPTFWRKNDDEVAGAGNTNKALFWEYDTRLGRLWNLDSKPQINISDYAVMRNNPISNNDIGGESTAFYDERFDFKWVSLDKLENSILIVPDENIAIFNIYEKLPEIMV